MSATGVEARRLISLSAPVVITQVSSMLLGVVDVIMVGRLGVEPLGAASLGHVWVMGTLIFGMGVICGMDPILTQAHGRRDARALGLCLQRGIVLALILCIPIGALLLLTAPCLRILGQDAGLSLMAQRYAVVQIPGVPPFLAFFALRQYLSGRGIMRPAMWILIAANGANVFFNWTLIFGNLGFPALGLEGAGLATTLTRVFLLISLVALVRGHGLHHGAWTPWSRASLRLSGLRELVKFGLPVGLHFSFEVWAFHIATLMAGHLGTVELAAHTVALNLASLSFMMPLGISIGTVTRVGNLIGERRFLRAQLAAWVALGLGAGVMAASAAVFILFRHELPWVYTESSETARAAAAVLPIAAAFQLFDGTQVVGTGILRGMGRTRPAAVFNLVGYYALALPLARWLAWTKGLGLAGIWWGLCLGLATVASLVLIWVRRYGPATLRRSAGERGVSRTATS